MLVSISQVRCTTQPIAVPPADRKPFKINLTLMSIVPGCAGWIDLAIKMLRFKSQGVCIVAGGGRTRSHTIEGARSVAKLPAAARAATSAVGTAGTTVSLLGSRRATPEPRNLSKQDVMVQDHLLPFEQALGYSFGHLGLCLHVSDGIWCCDFVSAWGDN